MIKYNSEFKLKIVKEYLNGCGSNTLAKRYSIGNHSTIMNWVHMYDKYGSSGLELRNKEKRYSGMFKIEVLNWIDQNNASFPEAAIHFNIAASTTIWRWHKKYDSEGISGFEYGQDAFGNMKKNTSKKDKSFDKDTLKRLEQENQRLRIENEFLKKVDALARKKSEQKRSPK